MFANETTMGSASDPIVFRNVISSAKDQDMALGNGNGAIFVDVINMTSVPYTESRFNKTQIRISSTAAGQANIYNFVNLDSTANRQLDTLATVSGSNNIGLTGGDSTRSFSTYGIGSEKTPTTNDNPGAGDWVIFNSSSGQLVYDDDNDAAGQGVGPASQALVSSIGILGQARSGATTEVGAFATLHGAPPPALPSSGGADTSDQLPFPSGIRGAALRGLGIRGEAIRGRHLRGPSRQE